MESEYRLEKNDDGDERESNDEGVEGDKKKVTNPFKTFMGHLFGWLQQLPVIGFNSGKYDINVIKRFFIPSLLTTSEDEDEDESCFVIKRLDTFMWLSTTKLRIVDVVNYLAPGFSYDIYLKAYGCIVQKGHFPYEYIDDLRKLEERSLPPQAKFYSRQKNKGITDEDYALCQETWCYNSMTTMRDLLVWYHNRDVVPSLKLSTNNLPSINSKTSICSKTELAFRD